MIPCPKGSQNSPRGRGGGASACEAEVEVRGRGGGANPYRGGGGLAPPHIRVDPGGL